ncbi:MAG: PAS domain-containing protein [Salinarimonadaceae bacterium]|nr:MAG: PAS domain-containing protein [Salinarimonadaceae bacterium]
MKHAATRMLFSYWDALRGERAAPDRGEIEPGEIRHILADTFILENEDGPARFRLAGTRLCALFGCELKNAPFSAIWDPAAPDDGVRQIDIVTSETAGIVAGIVGESTRGEPLDMELLLLPMRHRGRTHSRIIGALSPAIVPLWIGYDRLSHIRLTSMRVIWPVGRKNVASILQEEAPSERRRKFVVHPGGRA